MTEPAASSASDAAPAALVSIAPDPPLPAPAPPGGTGPHPPRPYLRRQGLAYIALALRLKSFGESRRIGSLLAASAGALGVGAVFIAMGLDDVGLALAFTTLVATGMVLPVQRLERHDRHLALLYVRTLGEAIRAWRRAFGRERRPTTPAEVEAWLASRRPGESDPDALDAIGSFLLLRDRVEEARATFLRMPDANPWQRFARSLCLSEVAWAAGEPADLTETRALAAAVKGPRAALAQAKMAVEEASRAVAEGQDWAPPVERAHRLLGAPITGVFALGVGQLSRVIVPLIVVALVLGTVLRILADRL